MSFDIFDVGIRIIQYPGTNANTNYFSFVLTGYMYKYDFIGEITYTFAGKIDLLYGWTSNN